MGGWPVHLTGPGGGSSGLAEALLEQDGMRGARVLFCAGSKSLDTIPTELGQAGATVRTVEVYRSEVIHPDGATVRKDLANGVDFVLFASPSAVEGLEGALGPLQQWFGPRTRAVCLGTTTSAALDARGVFTIIAPETSMESLVTSCIEVLRGDGWLRGILS